MHDFQLFYYECPSKRVIFVFKTYESNSKDQLYSTEIHVHTIHDNIFTIKIILTGKVNITTNKGRAESPSNHFHGSWSILVITNRASNASNIDPMAQATCETIRIQSMC